MRLRYISFIVLVFTSFASGCEQHHRSGQDQFKQRQEAILEQHKATPQVRSEETQPTPAAAQTAPTAATRPASAAGDKVVAIKDGDTIVLLHNGEQITVRLYGVDSPEKAQDFGQKAKQFTSDLAFNKYVQLIVKNKDRYGRTVGTIILPDGTSLNEELVRNGFAWHYKAYSNDKNLANLETDARRFKRGLWQSASPTPPWDFRKEKRSGGTHKATKTAATPLPAGAARRLVYLCNSTGSKVYHYDPNCGTLKRCKQETLKLTEATAIREYGRRPDKSCSQ